MLAPEFYRSLPGVTVGELVELWRKESGPGRNRESRNGRYRVASVIPWRYAELMTETTRILQQIEGGDRAAAEQLLPLVYAELRKLAAAKLSHEKPGQTLQATDLVHDAYLRLVDVDSAQHWDSRGHFFVAAGEAMRRILVEAARRKQCKKRGADWHRVELSDAELPDSEPNLDTLALNEALDRLEAKDARKAALVKLRYFAGLTNREAAAALGVSAATAENDWAYAKCWLKVQISQGLPDD